jgi:uncharacterized protein YndB with AHSA1/START domain
VSSKVLVALRVRATPQRAFEAFVGEIGAWWRPNAMFAFTPRAAGVLSFEPGEAGMADGRLIETRESREGPKVFEVGRIRAWEPPHRFVVGWRQATFTPDQDTEVTVTFEPVEPGETRVTVEHRGWDSVPTEHAAKHHWPDPIFLRRHGEWWQALLASYRDSLP